MSDIEEPAAKVSKLDDEHLEDDLGDGQEEWLSEEILTDEDDNTAAENDQSEFAANTSKEDSMDQDQQEPEQQEGEQEGEQQEREQEGEQQEGEHKEEQETSKQNIEETLNNFENSRSNDQTDMSEELSAFMVNKSEGTSRAHAQAAQEESDLDQSAKQSDDDGNDTDDLLRMLGEDDSKKKESPGSKSSQVKTAHHSSDDDDDDYIYEGAKVTKLKIAKDALVNTETQVKRLRVAKGAFIQKKVASKAVPEDLSDKEADENQMTSKVINSKTVKIVSKRPVAKAVSEEFSDFDEDSIPSSADESLTMKRMFGVRGAAPVAGSGAAAGAAYGAGGGVPRGRRVPRGGINAVKTVTTRVVSIEPKNVASKHSEGAKPPLKAATPRVVYRAPVRSTQGGGLQRLNEMESKSTPKATTPRVVFRAAPKRETSQELDADQHSDENSIEMYSEEERDGQRLMRPERMDEDIPSDEDSHSDGDSYYDELPSSESDDAEDWFTLDLRAERAADYLPLLGANARSLLTAERERAASRLTALRQSARALCAGQRALASQLRVARRTLAAIDAASAAH